MEFYSVSKERVTVYRNDGTMEGMTVIQAIDRIKAGTHKAYGRKAYEVPNEWIKELKPKRKPKNIISTIEEMKTSARRTWNDGEN